MKYDLTRNGLRDHKRCTTMRHVSPCYVSLSLYITPAVMPMALPPSCTYHYLWRKLFLHCFWVNITPFLSLPLFFSNFELKPLAFPWISIFTFDGNWHFAMSLKCKWVLFSYSGINDIYPLHLSILMAETFFDLFLRLADFFYSFWNQTGNKNNEVCSLQVQS